MTRFSVLLFCLLQTLCLAKQVSAVTFSDFNGANGITSAELLKKQGISIVRIDVPWSDIEKIKGRYNFEKYDKEIIAAKEAGFDVLPVLAYVPEWNKILKGKIGSPPLDISS